MFYLNRPTVYDGIKRYPLSLLSIEQELVFFVNFNVDPITETFASSKASDCCVV